MVMRVLIFGILGVVLPLSPARGRVPGAQIYNSSLRFVANAGQSDPAVRFQLDAAGETIFFTPEAVSFVAGGSPREQVSSDPIRLRFVAANPAPAVEGVDLLPGVANFLRGNDPGRWQTHVPTYGAVAYRDLYPGIDMVYRGAGNYLKSEFLVAPGAHPAAIQLAYEGVERVGLRAPDRPIFPREIPIRRRPTAPMYSWPSSTPMAS